jgi:hypothetical protein
MAAATADGEEEKHAGRRNIHRLPALCIHRYPPDAAELIILSASSMVKVFGF